MTSGSTASSFPKVKMTAKFPSPPKKGCRKPTGYATQSKARRVGRLRCLSCCMRKNAGVTTAQAP